MPHTHFRYGILTLALAVLAGCGNSASSSIADQFSASGRQSVDLASAVTGNWERVCVLGPYATDAVAAETLGFNWPAETLTEISRRDGISLLIFVRGTSVINHVEHPRDSADFSNLTGRCFSRSSARFVARPVKGWPVLIPAEGT